MTLTNLDLSLERDLATLSNEGRAKAPERVLVGWIRPKGGRGPRWRIAGSEREFLRMNSNSYLSLSHHPALISAADQATHILGVGPGAVRFIDGTTGPHAALEIVIADFVGRPAARIFNSAYTANLGLCIALTTPDTFWIGDELNHNCIIRGMRIASVAKDRRSIYKHNDMADLAKRLEEVPEAVKRVVVIFDGVFSMRGDTAPMAEIEEVVAPFREKFADGVVTVMDDSHGVGAFGETGRGTEEYEGARADILVGTFGKAFGVNGGFVASSKSVIEAVRQKADTYIYTNPLSAADAAAAIAAVQIVDGEEGRQRLQHLHERIAQFRAGLDRLGLESILGPHPVVPLLVRDTVRTRAIVQGLFERGILAVGLTFPVVPKGSETIRFQINAAHTAADIDEVLAALGELTK